MAMSSRSLPVERAAAPGRDRAQQHVPAPQLVDGEAGLLHDGEQARAVVAADVARRPRRGRTTDACRRVRRSARCRPAAAPAGSPPRRGGPPRCARGCRTRRPGRGRPSGTAGAGRRRGSPCRPRSAQTSAPSGLYSSATGRQPCALQHAGVAAARGADVQRRDRRAEPAQRPGQQGPPLAVPPVACPRARRACGSRSLPRQHPSRRVKPGAARAAGRHGCPPWEWRRIRLRGARRRHRS